jgi:lysophospholipase L1-like esterase
MRCLIAALVLALGLNAAAMAGTTTPQILLGVPQPVKGKAMTVDVIVENQANATPVATGTVTVDFGDGTTPASATLSNSLVTLQHTYTAGGNVTLTASYGGDSNFASATATQQAIVLNTAPAAITLNTYGDSITAGTGNSSPSTAYVSVITETEGWGLVDYAQGSNTVLDQCAVIYGVPTLAGQYSTLLIGQNEASYVGYPGTGAAEYEAALTACSAWLLTTPDSSHGAPDKLNAQSFQVTQSGSWTNSTYYTTMGLNSTVAGSSLTTSIAGTELYVNLTSTQTTNYTVSIAVDGKSAGTYSPQLDYVGFTHNYGPYGIRIPASGIGPHTVTVTCTTPGTYGCYVDWFGGNAAPAVAQPRLWLGTPYLTAQGIPAFVYSNMAADVASVEANLASDGLLVALADVHNYFSGTTDPQCMYDKVHPSDCGHALLAATFIGAMNDLLPLAPHVQLTSSGLHDFLGVADGLTETYGVKITNGTGAAYPVGIQLSGSPQFSEQNNCPASLANSASCEVVFSFAPTTGETGWVSTNWSLTNTNQSGILGQNGGELEGDGYAVNALTFTTNKHNFLTVPVGSTSSVFSLIGVNPGYAPFTGTIQLAGATSQFKMTGGCTLPLPAFSNCAENVQFAPTAKGTQTMTLTIVPTHGEQVTPSTVITFVGTGQ